MTPEQSRQIQELYLAAREIKPAERSAYLERACNGDTQLRLRVESMLNRPVAQILPASEETPHPGKELGRAGEPGPDDPTVPLVQEPTAGGIPRPLTVGTVLAQRFRLVRLLGRGGMGDVFEAEDLDLGRRVALKTIRREIALNDRIIERFKREIHLSQQVTHANVCRIYDLGTHCGTRGAAAPVVFLTMELLHGETLAQRLRRGPMDTTEALPIIRQLAAGLDAAHRAAVIHRDFKSGNVILVRSVAGGGVRAVVTDFGLARTDVSPSIEENASAESSGFVGTPDYMAPEQVLGEPLTAAADIYAFGIVMYEIVTGRRPFHGDTPLARATLRISQPPPSPRQFVPNLDLRWEAVILKCLARMPSARFVSASAAVEALTETRATGQILPLPGEAGPLTASPGLVPPSGRLRRFAIPLVLLALLVLVAAIALYRGFRNSPIDSLAILPLVNATGDESLEYVGDGLTEDLINDVAQRSGIRVISRSSVFQFKRAADQAQSAGRRLAVRAVLTGSVAKDPGGLVVSVELIDVATSRHLWGHRYQRPQADMAFLQDDIAQEVTATLNPAAGKTNSRKPDLRSSEVYQLYTQGRFYWNKRTQDGFRRAIELFRQALVKDPRYSPAWSGLADSYMFLSLGDGSAEDLERAKAAARKALEFDEKLASAHASLGYISYLFDWNWPEAEKELSRATTLDPNYASGHSWYARYLAAMGRAEQSLAESRRAVALDPLSLGVNTGYGLNTYLARRYEPAIGQFRKTLEIDSNFQLAHMDLDLTYMQAGRLPAAIQDLERLSESSNDTEVTLNLAYGYALAGRRNDALALIDKLPGGSANYYLRAFVYTALGEKDRAFDMLDQALRTRDRAMPLLKVQPELDSLHGDARFAALLRALRL